MNFLTYALIFIFGWLACYSYETSCEIIYVPPEEFLSLTRTNTSMSQRLLIGCSSTDRVYTEMNESALLPDISTGLARFNHDVAWTKLSALNDEAKKFVRNLIGNERYERCEKGLQDWQDNKAM